MKSKQIKLYTGVVPALCFTHLVTIVRIQVKVHYHLISIWFLVTSPSSSTMPCSIFHYRERNIYQGYYEKRIENSLTWNVVVLTRIITFHDVLSNIVLQALITRVDRSKMRDTRSQKACVNGQHAYAKILGSVSNIKQISFEYLISCSLL